MLKVNLKAYLNAEAMKNKHTVSAKLFWVLPLLCVAMSLIFSGQNARYYQTNQFNWWYTTFFPMLILLSAAFTVQREKKLKNRVISALPLDMRKLWAAKILQITGRMFCAAGVVTLAQEGFSRIFAAGSPRDISTGAGIMAAVLWVLLSAWQIPLLLFVNEKLGFAGGIILGLAGNMGLGILGALSGWWILNPFSYVSRIMCPVLGILPNGLPAVPESQLFFEGVLSTSVIPIGIVGAVIWFVICFAASVVWYQRKGNAGWEN